MRSGTKQDRPPSSTNVRLKKPLERRFKDYSLAAAGIGAVALAPAAAAGVVSTGIINHVVPINTTYQVNVGGQNAMIISNSTTSTSANLFASAPSAGVKGWAHPGPFGEESPVALNGLIPGTLVNFSSGALAFRSEGRNFSGFVGTGKYLGFSFGTGPNIHYGWIQLNVTLNGNGTYSVTVVQAAYETVAGQPLAAGALSDPAPPPTTPAPNSLWLLTMGAAGLAGLEAMRRRKGV